MSDSENSLDSIEKTQNKRISKRERRGKRIQRSPVDCKREKNEKYYNEEYGFKTYNPDENSEYDHMISYFDDMDSYVDENDNESNTSADDSEPKTNDKMVG